MQGIYVDVDAHLVLVYAHAPDGNDYSVYLNQGDSTDLAVATTTDEGVVRLEEVDVINQGQYNGVDSIHWKDGRTWRRLEMSDTQYRLLTGRPYVPLTYLAWRVLKCVATRMATTMRVWVTTMVG